MTDIFVNGVGIVNVMKKLQGQQYALDIGDSVNVNDGCCFAFVTNSHLIVSFRSTRMNSCNKL